MMPWAIGGASDDTSDLAFDEVFRAVWPRAVLAARRIVGPQDDPEGLAAESMTRAYDRWPSLRRHPAPDAWVLRVTINLALDRVRYQSRRTATTLIDLRTRGLDATSAASFDELSVLRLALATALAELPDKQRQAVAMRYLGGCVEQDIAASMKVSPGTVKTHLGRGLEKLRAQAANDPEAHLALVP